MKICHISTVHPQHDSRIRKQCKTLIESGHEVALIIQSDECKQEDGLSIYPLKSYKNRLLRMTLGVYSALKLSLKINGDCYHFHDPELIPIGLLLKINRKKVVYDIHEDVPKQIIDKNWILPFFRVLVSAIFKIFEEFAVRFFDGTISATPSICSRFKKINSNSISIHNFPDLSKDNLDFKRPSESDQLRLLYVGAITRERGILTILDSIVDIDCILELGGNFENDRLYSECLHHNSWEKVNYHGYIDREKYFEILKVSDIGLVIFHPISNHIEAMPNKIFDYMSVGLPVLCSNFNLWVEIVEKNETGYCVDPESILSIRNGIQFLASKPDLMEAYSKNAIKISKSKYNWEIEAAKLIEFYRCF